LNEKEAYQFLADRLGLEPEVIPYLVEMCLEMTVLNPILPETVRRLGRILDLRPGQRVLDLACGKAGVSLPLVRTYKVNLTGVDLMPDFIREAWSRAEYSGIYENCRFRLDDAARFAAETKEQWDAVLVVGAMTIIWDSLAAGLAGVKPLVRPGGCLVIGQPYLLDQDMVDPEGQDSGTKEEITTALSQAGEVLEILDDGRPGWEALWKLQQKDLARLKKQDSDNQSLMTFMDQWTDRWRWEMENLGFALWVIRVK